MHFIKGLRSAGADKGLSSGKTFDPASTSMGILLEIVFHMNGLREHANWSTFSVSNHTVFIL